MHSRLRAESFCPEILAFCFFFMVSRVSLKSLLSLHTYAFVEETWGNRCMVGSHQHSSGLPGLSENSQFPKLKRPHESCHNIPWRLAKMGVGETAISEQDGEDIDKRSVFSWWSVSPNFRGSFCLISNCSLLGTSYPEVAEVTQWHSAPHKGH